MLLLSTSLPDTRSVTLKSPLAVEFMIKYTAPAGTTTTRSSALLLATRKHLTIAAELAMAAAVVFSSRTAPHSSIETAAPRQASISTAAAGARACRVRCI
eukprot:Amastigsp_a344997_45.p2 type:complete len:100 gc:universal Amastigsp_a344997_45:1116-1415(+)